MIQKSKCNQYFCLFFCFFLSIYNMSFFVISVLPYVVIIHCNFFTYILHNLPHFRCHSTFFRKNGEIYPSARHPSTTSKAQTNITFLSLPLSERIFFFPFRYVPRFSFWSRFLFLQENFGVPISLFRFRLFFF